MHRIVVTGANGAGKSTFARSLARDRPDLPPVHFDTLKPTADWIQRERSEIEERLRAVVDARGWILEGGPSLLGLAMPRAEALVWLDPPTIVRAGRLIRRPWGALGGGLRKTRPERPEGNPDRLWQPYRFAVRSLRDTQAFRASVAPFATALGADRVWHCRSGAAARAALAALVGLAALAEAGPTPPSRPQ